MQSDQFLITQFQAAANKEACFTELLKRHQQKVYYQVKRMVTTHADADDIAQQVWIKVWNKLDGFKMESEFGTWVFRIAYNESLNFLQKQKRNNSRVSTNDTLAYEHATAESDLPKSTEVKIVLESAIKQLPEKQRIVFIARYFDALPYEKIAEIMGTTVGGAKANFHQAVKKIENFIRKD